MVSDASLKVRKVVSNLRQHMEHVARVLTYVLPCLVFPFHCICIIFGHFEEMFSLANCLYEERPFLRYKIFGPFIFYQVLP